MHNFKTGVLGCDDPLLEFCAILRSRPFTSLILNHPAWSGFPVQTSPGYQASADNRQVVSYADHLPAQMDNYVLSLRPVAAGNGDAAVMVNQTLKGGSSAWRCSPMMIRRYRCCVPATAKR
jgi:hypothetical protein